MAATTFEAVATVSAVAGAALEAAAAAATAAPVVGSPLPKSGRLLINEKTRV